MISPSCDLYVLAVSVKIMHKKSNMIDVPNIAQSISVFQANACGLTAFLFFLLHLEISVFYFIINRFNQRFMILVLTTLLKAKNFFSVHNLTFVRLSAGKAVQRIFKFHNLSSMYIIIYHSLPVFVIVPFFDPLSIKLFYLSTVLDFLGKVEGFKTILKVLSVPVTYL